MDDITRFGLLAAIGAVTMLLAILSNRLSARILIPAPAIFLVGAAIASDVFPDLASLSVLTVQRAVTIALIPILFDGGMNIGRRRFREAAGAIAWTGVVGTLATTCAVALLAHLIFGFATLPALLLGAALAPTDPAVVFSVLGRREIGGRSGLIIEGESGANDPVGIAIMVSLLATVGSTGWRAVGHGAVEFTLGMAIGAAVGVLGGRALLVFMRRVPLPAEGLYPLRTFAGAVALYGIATVAHGSGFLAVFVAGILIGDERAPYKREIARFHSALASLGEIVAFVMLGLTVQLRTIPHGDAWLIGLVLAVLLALLVRPLLLGLLLLPIKLSAPERVFVLWSGLKGAVPVLLGTFIITTAQPNATKMYDIIFVVVAFSVIVQGGLVPAVAGRLGVPMRTNEPEPWSLGLRFRDEPRGIHQYTIAAGSPADGATIAELPFGDDFWISLVRRSGVLVQVRGGTRLRAGDVVLALADADRAEVPARLFGLPADPPG